MDLECSLKRKLQHSVLRKCCSLNKVLCFKVPELLCDLWTICLFHCVKPKAKFGSVQINLKPKLKTQLQIQIMNVEI